MYKMFIWTSKGASKWWKSVWSKAYEQSSKDFEALQENTIVNGYTLIDKRATEFLVWDPEVDYNRKL